MDFQISWISLKKTWISRIAVLSAVHTHLFTCAALPPPPPLQAWAFTLDCAVTELTWTRLPDIPFGVYDFRASASPSGAIFTFGGHLCTSTIAGG